jgi:hypothetical protein
MRKTKFRIAHYSKVKILILRLTKSTENTFVNVPTIDYGFDSGSVCVPVFRKKIVLHC